MRTLLIMGTPFIVRTFNLDPLILNPRLKFNIALLMAHVGYDM